MHTASRKNPPPEALAQAGRESRRAYESDWHIWTELEIDDIAVAWDVTRTVAEFLLNFQQLEEAAARHVSMVNLGLLGRRIEVWGWLRYKDGQYAERERYQEQGE